MSTTEQHAADLDARYGRTRSTPLRNRTIAWSVGAAFAVVLIAWLVWGGLLGAPAQIDVDDTGHVIASDSLVQVRYQLTVEPGTKASCAVQALNSAFSIVGWRVVDIPASDKRVRSIGTDVRTTEPAVTGLIYRCWLT